MSGPMRTPVADRFWRSVDTTGGLFDGCWLWQLSLSSDGYDEANTARRPSGRRCRECHRQQEHARHERRRSAA